MVGFPDSEIDLLYILAGPDDFSRARTLDEIKHGLGDESILSMSTTILEGQKLTVDELKHSCETVPFLSEKRLVVINGLIDRFDASSKSEKTRTNTQSQPRDPTPFINCLNNIPEFTIVVMVENEPPNPSKKDGLFKSISGKAEVRIYPLIKDAKLRSWIQKRVTDSGGSISPPALEALFQLVGSNLWIMASEIDKILLFASGRRIEETDVRTMVGYTQDISVFAMIDAIIDFKVEQAGQTLQQLLDHGAAPAYLLYMLDRQFRMIVQVKAMKDQGKSNGVIQSKLSINNEYALRRTLDQAGRYSMERLMQIYRSLLDTDLALKTGRYDSELALNLLIAELCQRGNRKPARIEGPYAGN
jgi:DNA polymerase-3 subunit delta